MSETRLLHTLQEVTGPALMAVYASPVMHQMQSLYIMHLIEWKSQHQCLAMCMMTFDPRCMSLRVRRLCRVTTGALALQPGVHNILITVLHDRFQFT